MFITTARTQWTISSNGKLPLLFAALEFPVDGLANEIKARLAISQETINPGNGLGSERQGNAISPKFFSSHGNFSYV